MKIEVLPARDLFKVSWCMEIFSGNEL